MDFAPTPRCQELCERLEDFMATHVLPAEAVYEEQREASGDPRPSLEERYPTFDDYLMRFTGAAQELVRQRYVLEEDIPGLLKLAERQRWRDRRLMALAAHKREMAGE